MSKYNAKGLPKTLNRVGAGQPKTAFRVGKLKTYNMAQNEQQMTLEQIEAHIKSANLEQYDGPQAKAAAPHDLASQLKRVCTVYKAIKPILTVVVNFPLIPSSIKNAVKSFMNVMNTICP